jgi:protein-tyrosine phosphatase
MIDLHCHLLPGIDDGAATASDALAMARQAAAAGVEIVVATPHIRADHPRVEPEELASRTAELNEELMRNDIRLQVIPGGEVDLFWAERASDADLRLVTIGQRGHTLLIETPYGFLSDVFEDLVAEIVGRGFRVVLAHPERSPTLRKDLTRTRELAEEGIVLQVNAGSVTGKRADAETSAFAATLVSERIAHVIASDSHSPGDWRPPDLHEGLEAARGLSPASAEWMVDAVPRALLTGTSIPPRPAEDPGRRRWRPGRRR